MEFFVSPVTQKNNQQNKRLKENKKALMNWSQGYLFMHCAVGKQSDKYWMPEEKPVFAAKGINPKLVSSVIGCGVCDFKLK